MNIGTEVVVTVLSVGNDRASFLVQRHGDLGAAKVMPLRLDHYLDVCEGVRLRVHEVFRNGLCLEFWAPVHIKIYRGEIYERIQQEKILNYLEQHLGVTT